MKKLGKLSKSKIDSDWPDKSQGVVLLEMLHQAESLWDLTIWKSRLLNKSNVGHGQWLKSTTKAQSIMDIDFVGIVIILWMLFHHLNGNFDDIVIYLLKWYF